MRPNKRDELVQKALTVFYRNGFHATGMDMLVKETGVSKTSMYKHFRTKEELILAALQLRDDSYKSWLLQRIQEIGDTPTEQILAMFDVLEEWFVKPDFQGCMFIKASAEFQDHNHPIYKHSAGHKRAMLDHITVLAGQAGIADAETLSCQLMLLMEGAIVTKAMGLGCNPAQDAKLAAQVLLHQARNSS